MLAFLTSQGKRKHPSHGRLAYGFRANYTGLAEDDQCSVFFILGQIICTSIQAEERQLPERTVTHISTGPQTNDCPLCNGRLSFHSSQPPPQCLELEHISTIFSELLQLLQKPKRRGPRVAAMITLKRLLLHASFSEHHDLANSLYGQWCLQALRASARELRIAAGSVHQAPLGLSP